MLNVRMRDMFIEDFQPTLCADPDYIAIRKSNRLYGRMADRRLKVSLEVFPR